MVKLFAEKLMGAEADTIRQVRSGQILLRQRGGWVSRNATAGTVCVHLLGHRGLRGGHTGLDSRVMRPEALSVGAVRLDDISAYNNA